MNSNSKHISLIVWGGVLIFAVVFSVLALNRHAAFESNGFDLGNVNQAIWNTARGRPLAFTNMAPLNNRLALHVEPILFLFVPFYWLGMGGPALLLITQAIVVALGAWPLYLIARPRLGEWGAAVISLAYLLYPALESAILFDFHAVTLAPTFFLFAFYFLDKRLQSEALKPTHSFLRQAQDKLVIPSASSGQALHPFGFAQDKPSSFILHPSSFIFLILAMATKEDMGLVAAMFGLYIGLAYKRWKPAALLFVFGLVWSAVAILLIQPQFAPGGNIQGERYAWLFDAISRPAVIWDHLWNQADLPGYLFGLFAPVAGLALFAPPALLPVLPSLVINLLSSHPLTWRLEEFHYAAPVAPFVFIAAILGIARLEAGKQVSRACPELAEGWAGEKVSESKLTRLSTYPHTRTPAYPHTRTPAYPHTRLSAYLLILLLTASLAYHYFRGFSPLARPFQMRDVGVHQIIGAEMAAQIDPLLPLFAPLNLNPHVSSREVLHQEFDQIAPDDWLWLDVATLPNENNIQQYIRDVLLPQYELVKARDGYLLLKPGGATEALPASFYTFALSNYEPQYSLSVTFGESLALIGYDLRFNRAEEVEVVTYWRALKPLPANISPVLFLAYEDGALAGETQARALSPTMIWLPPERWPAKETVAITFNRLNWDTRNRDAFRLGVGVTTAEDPWGVGARQRPAVAQSPFANQLLADGTVLELARFRRVAGFPEGAPPARQMMRPVIEHRLETTFEGQIRLLGYNTPQIRQDDSGHVIQLDLLWQGAGESRDSYIRFAQLIGPEGLAGQNDSPPVNGMYPTSLWAEGEYVLETVEIPFEAYRLSEQYTLHIGFYSPLSGQRLRNGQGQDHIEIPLK